jgi:cellulose biosynthesis protein BcsQ
VPAEVITIASLKGGVGKTTTSYALAAAAAAGGLRVVAIDLDPTGGLSNVLEKAKRSITIADVLHQRVSLLDALIEHPLGIKTVAGHRSLNEEALPAAQLQSIFEPIRDSVDLILLDTHPHEPSLLGPMSVADRIVIPTALDILSLRAAALTVGLAQQLGVLDKIRGIVVTNAKRPMSRITESLLNGLTLSGLAFETVLWYSSGWVLATSGRGELPEQELLDQTKVLLREVAVRPSPVEALRRFIAMAQGRRGRPASAPLSPFSVTHAPALSG